MSKRAELVCAILVSVELVLDFLLVMAIESGSLAGVAAGLSVAGVLLLQLTTIGYIKANWRKDNPPPAYGRSPLYTRGPLIGERKEDADGTVAGE